MFYPVASAATVLLLLNTCLALPAPTSTSPSPDPARDLETTRTTSSLEKRDTGVIRSTYGTLYYYATTATHGSCLNINILHGLDALYYCEQDIADTDTEAQFHGTTTSRMSSDGQYSVNMYYHALHSGYSNVDISADDVESLLAGVSLNLADRADDYHDMHPGPPGGIEGSPFQTTTYLLGRTAAVSAAYVVIWYSLVGGGGGCG